MRAVIETRSGAMLDLAAPDPALIRVEDVAWGLARMPRFAAQSTGELGYSVGQHSMVVARLAADCASGVPELRASLAVWREAGGGEGGWRGVDACLDRVAPWRAFNLGLVHDASEAFLVDLPTPLKRLPGLAAIYGALEERMMAACHEALGIPAPAGENGVEGDLVKWADLLALRLEALAYTASRGETWTVPWPPLPPEKVVASYAWDRRIAPARLPGDVAPLLDGLLRQARATELQELERLKRQAA